MFLEKVVIMASPVQRLSETHLSGEDTLFLDTRATLDAEFSNLLVAADVFDPITDWPHIETLKLKELDPGSPIVRAKVNELVHISRAEALAYCSDLRRFKESLQGAFPALAEG